MFSDLILMMILVLILIVCVLVGVAFLTLLERKLLGYIQIRKGPNKVGFMGLLQPFSDAIKLFSKEQTFPFMSNFSIYYISPVVNLIIALLLWLVLPILSMNLSFMLGVLYFLAISSLGVYSIMLAGWSSNSNYSLLGSMRAVAQTISYEVSMFLIMMGFILLILSFNLLDFFIFQKNVWFLFLCLPFCFMWIITCLAETNRSPFDFAEGESELVSGFNVEYSSGGFAMIFLAEYASILFMSMISTLMFLGSNMIFFSLKLSMVSFFWIWVRGTLPRFRYDKLMYLVWKSFLSCVLIYLIFFFNLKFIISVLIL